MLGFGEKFEHVTSKIEEGYIIIKIKIGRVIDWRSSTRNGFLPCWSTWAQLTMYNNSMIRWFGRARWRCVLERTSLFLFRLNWIELSFAFESVMSRKGRILCWEVTSTRSDDDDEKWFRDHWDLWIWCLLGNRIKQMLRDPKLDECN